MATERQPAKPATKTATQPATKTATQPATKTATKPATKAAAKTGSRPPAARSTSPRAARPPARPWLDAYPPGVPRDIDVPPVPLTALLDQAATAFGQSPALAFLGRSYSYQWLRDSVDRAAGGLRQLGVAKGDRVGLVLPNCPQYVVTFFAAARLGAVAVPVNPLSTAPELRAQLGDAGCQVVVCLDKAHRAVTEALTGASPGPGTGRSERPAIVVASLVELLPRTTQALLKLPLPALARRREGLTETALPAGTVRFTKLLAAQPVRTDAAHPDDLAALLYTGGTTGIPRGARLTHANLVANAHQARAWLPDAVPGREATIAVLPLFHAFGTTLCLTVTVLLAGRLVLLPRFDADEVIAAIRAYRATILPGVPPIFQAVADAAPARPADFSSLRLCISGAMRLPEATRLRFEQVTGIPLLEGYGTTEAAPATHANPKSDRRRPGTIGVPLPGTDAKIVHPSSRRAVAAGKEGELAVRGPQVFAGYWGETPPGTFTTDGYLLTGDIARMDPDGFFTVVDRAKDLIITGGFNVYPAEVEEAISSLAGVAECVVVGVPDRHRGELVKAFVVPAAGAAISEEQVRVHCAKSLAPYKVPHEVEVRRRLPRSGVGKPLRRLLAAAHDAEPQ